MFSFADFETNFGGVDNVNPASADQRQRIREGADLPNQGLDHDRLAHDVLAAATRAQREFEKPAGA